MTKKSNDEHKEELNINDAPIKDQHHHTKRGHLAHDSGPVDDDAINEDLHNVIAAYWKDRQKPGFIGYKNNQEDEEEEVRVENDVDISFLKNPRRTKSNHQENSSACVKNYEVKSAETRAITANVKKSDTLPDESVESEKTAGFNQKAEETLEKPVETLGNDEVSALTKGLTEQSSTPAVKTDLSAESLPQFQISAKKLTEAKELIRESAGAGDMPKEITPATLPKTSAPSDKVTTTNDQVTRGTAHFKQPFEERKSADTLNRGSQHSSPANHDLGKSNIKHTTTKKKKRKKKKGIGRFFKWFFTILIILVIGGTVTLGIMRYIGWRNSNRTNDSGEDISTPEGAISEDGGKTVVYKGVTYTYNEELSTILFIGVDKEEYEDNGVSGEAGQADTVILTVVNQKTGEIRMIPLSRSTMVAIDQYNADGSYWKQDILQLAVSFAYGKNIDENCKNVAKAVSRILYGMPVHRFVTMDLSAIPQLNDAVGGVTVNCLEDMTDVNESWTEGAEITLHGKEAETYVRHRKTTISDETQDNNAPRMERQKQYINSFMHALLTGMKGDIFIPLRLYRDVGDDIYSDVTTSEIVYYTSMVVSKGFNNSMLSIKGTVKHNKFTEFYPNEEELYQLILDTFYERQ